MGLLSYGVGILPLHLDINQQIKPVSLFSNGLLIGAALCLAIPESIENYNKNPGNDSKWIGISIMLGFISMILIDQKRVPANTNSTIEINEFMLYNDESNTNNGGGLDIHGYSYLSIANKLKSISQVSLTLALLIHAMIDGIALGSSFHNDNISFVFSLIIIIHKLPTCFSLSCLLLQQRINISIIKFHILVFVLTTPIMTFITWLVLLMFKGSDTVIGILLLYSSGTFIYILTHILNEFKEISFSELGLLITGILIPGFLSFMH